MQKQKQLGWKDGVRDMAWLDDGVVVDEDYEGPSDDEAREIRDFFGYLVLNEGSASHGSKSVHLPLDEDMPLCQNMSNGPNRYGFNTKHESVYPHGYIEDSSYDYCSYCVSIYRKFIR